MTQEQKSSIVALARNMYVKEGLRAVRMDDIAQAAGVSKRTLYEAFGDKEELVYLAMSHHFEMLRLEHEEITKDAPNILVAIMWVMEHVLKTSESNWKLLNAMKRFHPKVKERIDNENIEEKQAIFRMALESGVRGGLLNPKADLDLSITMLQFLTKSVVTESDELKLPKGVTTQMAFIEIMITIMRGISTPKGLEVIDTYVDNIKSKL